MACLINPLFEYPKLSRAEIAGARRYVLPCGAKAPSVTTILGATKDMSHLIEWRARVGEVKAAQTLEDASKTGTNMHGLLELYIQGLPWPKAKSPFEIKSQKMAQTIIENGMVNLQEVYGWESALYYETLWAGTSDLIALKDNQITILDYKNSGKIKKEEWIEDYYMQGAAYAIAHNWMFGTKIQQICIFMVTRPVNIFKPVCEFKEFQINGIKFQTFCDKWIARVEQYYQSH